MTRRPSGGGRFDLPGVLRRLAETAARACRFGAVTVNLRTPEGDYAVVVDTDGELLGTRTPDGFWADLLGGGQRVGAASIIPPAHVRRTLEAYPEVCSVAPELPPATTPEDWDPDHMLVVPMLGRGGENVGYFSVDCPPDRRIPSPELVADMGTFAEHVALTVELAAEAEALRASEERFRSLVQNSTDVIAVLDAGGITRYVSPAVESVLGYAPEERVGVNALEAGLAHPEDEARVRAAFAAIVAEPGAELRIRFRLRHRDGSWRHAEVVGRNMLGDPSVGGVVVNYRDVTERQEYEEQLRHRALHDPLTGLPNRALFLDRLDHALARTARHRSTTGVLYVDVDRLKRVNDSLGHDAGDALLVGIAERLRGSVRPEDTVARLSGDEFAVLIEEVGAASEAESIAERILAALAAPLVVANHEVVATASVGIVVGGPADTSPAALLQAADVVMYRAKAGGGARYAVYGADMASLALERLELESDMRRALDRGEFEVFYQPKVELGTGRVAAMEALVRWRHPTRGLLLPSEFLGIAEETGLIVPIGRRVLGEACRRVREWRDRYPSDPPLHADVNLSAREFAHPGTVGEVARILRENGLDAGGLELEITEDVVMADTEAVARTLRDLADLGVRLAIDDFGTGYSSLARLKRFPISTLKIDKSFVAGLDRDPEDAAIVRAVLGLGRALRLTVVAEGAETTEHVAALRALGCEMVQGYYLSRPLPAEELEAVLADGRPLG